MFFLTTQFYNRSIPTAMQIAAKFPIACLPAHGTHYFAIDNEGSDVGTFCLFNKFLYNDTRLHAMKSLDHRLGCFFIFSKDNSKALCSFEEFDHHGGSA